MKYAELFSPDAGAARDQVLDQMRRDDPIYWCEHESLRAWIITAYEDVYNLFMDERLRFGSARGELMKQSEEEQREFRPFIDALDHSMSYMPRERHKRLQKLLLESLSMKELKTLEPHIRLIIDQVIGDIATDKVVNLVSRFSYPIPAYVIANLVGIPDQDRQQFIEWTAALEAVFWPYDYDRFYRASHSLTAMMDYFRDLMPATVDRGANTFLARFGQAVNNAELTEEEALVSCAILMFAGHETTASVINAGIQLLAEQRPLLELLKTDHTLMPATAAELLRYKPAVGWMRRTAIEDFEYKGRHISKGDVLFLGTYAANRDPAYFPDPHRFDIHRQSAHASMTFGAGRHFCLGAALAKMEIELALSGLIEAFPDLDIEPSQIKCSPTRLLMQTVTDLPLTPRHPAAESNTPRPDEMMV